MFLAMKAGRGQAPWVVERVPGYALPESIDARPWTGPNAVLLAVAADKRGYSDPRWGSEE